MEEDLEEVIELLGRVKEPDYINFILCLLRDYINKKD